MLTSAKAWTVLLALWMFVWAKPAHAALGDLLPSRGPTVHTARFGAQTLRVRERRFVKEFADSDRKVFAVSWSGPVAPALLDLLGPYKDEYEAALRSRRRGGHNHLSLHTANLDGVVTSRGRHFTGCVVVTSQLPKGVTIDALR